MNNHPSFRRKSESRLNKNRIAEQVRNDGSIIGLVLILLLLLYGCAAKQTELNLTIPMFDDNEFVLENIKLNTFEVCEYSGRITFRYVDPYNDVSSNGILRKTCEGNMIVRALGPFGVTMAEMTVEYGVYTARRGNQDVTENIIISHEDMLLLQNYLRLPPPMPDDSFIMIIGRGQYMFLRGEEVFYVSPNFQVTDFITPDHRVGFVWAEDGGLKTLAFSRNHTTLYLDFTDRWNIKK